MTDLWVPGQPKALPTPQARLAAFNRRPEETPEVIEMRTNRRINASRSAAAHTGAAEISFATGRPKDPMWYWRQNNLPYDIDNAENMAKLRAYCRMLYLTHPLIASAIDIYSKFPLAGMEIECKDTQVKEFYEQLFFDQLDYEAFLIEVLREYWTVGEAFPFGSFNETLGVWEDDELLSPDDIRVIKSPFLKKPRYEMRLPESIRLILSQRSPQYEYAQLITNYPELARFQGQDDYMPVSGDLIGHLAFKANPFHPRGLPILLRGMRAVLQEEMLNAAQDAVADRLYTPLVLARLGASAADLGTQEPWVPEQGALTSFEDALDAALAGDFRTMVTHFATDISTVFGRETVPDFNADFERLGDRQLQVFGLSRTMLTGGSAGETYAADALNRDVVSQLLSAAQRLIQRFFHDRAEVVAEAQQFYDYDLKGGKRVPIMEEVLIVDPETGEQRIEERHKLLIPTLKIRSMNLRQEDSYRAFLEGLIDSGVPISDATRVQHIGLDLEEEREKKQQEQVEKAVAEQETRELIYLALKQANLPVPQDIALDFEPKAQLPAAPPAPVLPHQLVPGVGDVPPPMLGADPLVDTPTLEPTPEDYLNEADADAEATGKPAGDFVTQNLPRNKALPDEGAGRPPESDEQRAGMPRSAGLQLGAWRTRGTPNPLVAPPTVIEAEAHPTDLALAGPLLP